MGDLGVI